MRNKHAILKRTVVENWHNTGQERPYFHHGSLGRTKKQRNVWCCDHEFDLKG